MEWIKCSDRSPLPFFHVLLFDAAEGICVGYWNGEIFSHYPHNHDGTLLFNITHWMDLPEPPKE